MKRRDPWETGAVGALVAVIVLAIVMVVLDSLKERKPRKRVDVREAAVELISDGVERGVRRATEKE